jgi:hypothetical protein
MLSQVNLISLFTQCSTRGQAVPLAARSRRSQSSFKPCKVNLYTRHVGALHPHTRQLSPSIPWQKNRAHGLAYNAPIVLGCRRATAALVPTIASMGEPVSGPVRGIVYGQVQSGIRLIGYHISRHVFSTFKRLTQVSTH